MKKRLFWVGLVALLVALPFTSWASVSDVYRSALGSGGILGVAAGGTGASSLTGILLGNGTSAISGISTSAGISAALSDETGTGALVFGTTPTFTTSVILPLIKPSANSTTAVQVTKADGTTVLLNADTTNRRIGINNTSPTTDLDITGSLNVSGSITGGSGPTLFGAAVRPAVVTLTDGATPALDAALGNVFVLTAAGNRTIAVPTNAVSGQGITIAHIASGGARTLALNTGAGGFRFGETITGLTATTSGKTDYIHATYNATDSKWDVNGYVKGY